jgi:proteic killer suppression protein
VIKTFACPKTEAFYVRGASFAMIRRIADVARRKLRMLDAAHEVLDLRAPPGNRLEKLKGDRAGQYSIRINDQYRVGFTWRGGHAHNVEITDCH